MSWSEVSQQWDTLQGDTGDAYRRLLIYPSIVQQLGFVKGRAILDVGSGNGSLSRCLGSRGATVLGIELSPLLVQRARRRGGALVAYIEADACNPVRHGLFDTVISVFSHQDMGSIDALFGLARSNLIKGGQVIVVFEDLRQVEKGVDHTSSRREWVGTSGTGMQQRIWWVSEDGSAAESVVTTLWPTAEYGVVARRNGFLAATRPKVMAWCEGLPPSYKVCPRFVMQVFRFSASEDETIHE